MGDEQAGNRPLLERPDQQLQKYIAELIVQAAARLVENEKVVGR